MPVPNFWGMLGYETSATIFDNVFASSSDVILTDNPEYTLEDFCTVFPVFPMEKPMPLADEGEGEEKPGEVPSTPLEPGTYTPPTMIPLAFFNLVLTMANASIKYDRYKSGWKYLMGLYIAHMCTLFLQTQDGDATAENALKGSLPRGVQSSKTVEGLSVTLDFMGVTTDLDGYGTWKLTTYGQQLATLTKMYGHGGTWLNG